MEQKKNRNWVPGIILTALVLAAAVAFLAFLARMKMIPTKYLAVIAVIIGVLLLTVCLLMLNYRRKGRFLAGMLLSYVMIALFVLGSLYIHKTQSTITDISGVNTEVTQVSVFVRSEDPADSVQATEGYTYGILASLDRENTDGAIEHLKQEFGGEVTTMEYAGLTELADGLLNSQTGAIVLNKAYLSVIEEMDGYADIESKIKELGSVEVENVIEANNESNATPVETEKGGKIYTIYISGIDSREGMVAKSRSDVNIIATVNTDTHQALLVSTPRDYFVPLSISGGQPDKLTHAGIYGIDVCMDTLGMLYDIDINYYFRINFEGFVQIIDALGGITVYSDYEFDSGNITGYHFNQGENYVNGEQALVFARERYAFQEGDRQRGKNQMAVIKGVVNKVLSTDLLANYSSVLSSLQGCFSTNITYEEIAELLQEQLNKGGSWDIISYSVDGTGDTQKPYSMSQNAYVMVPDYNTVDKAKSLMQAVRDGQTITQEQADAAIGSTTAGTAATDTTGTDAAATDMAGTDTAGADTAGQEGAVGADTAQTDSGQGQ